MLTLNDLNLFLGVGWDENYTEKIDLTFHEQDGGRSQEVSAHCKGWHHRFALQAAVQTAHLPNTMTFKLDDLRNLFRRLRQGYKNFNVVLPLQFSQTGFEVLYGPCKGSKIPNVRR
jgi:hypothetical protein